MSYSYLEPFSCNSTSACPALYECIQSVCMHKSPLPPTEREIWGSVLLVFLLGMCNVGGMGGSFLASPILMIIFNFDTIPAIRTTYCMSLCGAIGNFLTNIRSRKPGSRKPAIDYDVAVLCIPLLISGASIGVIANSFLPPIISLSFLILLCLNSFFKCLRKAIAQYRYENAEKKAMKVATAMAAEGVTASDTNNSFSIDTDIIEEDLGKDNLENNSKQTEMEALNIENAPQPNYSLFPLKRYFEILILLCIVVGFLLLRGSKAFTSVVDVEFCGGLYWMIYVFAMASCFIFNCIAQYKLKKEKPDPTIRPQDFDVRKRPVKLSIISFFAGIMAGFAGTGGGLILNPVFLDLGMTGPVAAATSNFFVLFTAFISVFQTAIGGTLPLDNGLYFGSLSFFGAMVIASTLKCFVKRYNRTSLILFLLCVVTMSGALVVGTYIGYRMMIDPESMTNLGTIC